MEVDAWSASVKVVDGEVIVDQLISVDNGFPTGTWVLDDCIWANENEVRTVAQKRIKTRFKQRKKNVIFQKGNPSKLYSVQEFIDLMAV